MPYTKKEKRDYLKQMDKAISACSANTIETEDARWEVSIKHQPDRYQVAREKSGELKVIYNTDSGRLHMKCVNNGVKIWVEFP
jgi:hypothetical protein